MCVRAERLDVYVWIFCSISSVWLFHCKGYRTYTFFFSTLSWKIFVSDHLLHCLYQPPSPPLQEEISGFPFKKFHGLGGKDLTPCRALRERSKKENNPVFLAFSGCPRHLSTADTDKISSKALVSQAAGFWVILAFKILFFFLQRIWCRLSPLGMLLLKAHTVRKIIENKFENVVWYSWQTQKNFWTRKHFEEKDTSHSCIV